MRKKADKNSATEIEVPGEPIRFDLTSEPWIGVVTLTGARDRVVQTSLMDVLCNAHELWTVRDAAPPVEFGLLRLLVTFALDIFPCVDGRDWQDIWKRGRFDKERVAAYLKQYADRLDLFHARHPFLQDAAADGGDRPLAGLDLVQPSGTNAVHFHHGTEENFAVSPAVAARLLTTVAPFMTAGGAGLSPSINGAPPWYLMLQGENLFQTIWLNAPVIAKIRPRSKGDLPAWRDDRPVVKEDRVECGLLEAFTWRPRRIRLVAHRAPEGGARCAVTGAITPVVVDRMKFSAGWSTRLPAGAWHDPNVAYKPGKEGPMVLRCVEGREAWRDIGALALAAGSDGAERPGIVEQFAEFVKLGSRLPRDTPFRCSLYGIRTDMKMKVFEWRREHLVLPVPLLLAQRFHGIAETEMRLAENIAYAMRLAIKHNFPDDGKSDKRAFESLIDRTHSAFWQRLHRHYAESSDSLLVRLAATDDDKGDAEIIEAWRLAVRREAMEVLDRAIEDFDGDGDAMKRQMESRRTFGYRVWAYMHPEEAAAKKSAKAKVKAAALAGTT